MKKGELIASRIPSELLEHAAALYRESRITLEVAASEAGVSMQEILDFLRQKKIPMQYDLEDFEKDLQGIYQRLGKE
jgi:predicted HTH domain antitoxin